MMKRAFLQKAKLKVMPENAGCAAIGRFLAHDQANEARGHRQPRGVSRRGAPWVRLEEAQVVDAAACGALHCDKKDTVNKKTTF